MIRSLSSFKTSLVEVCIEIQMANNALENVSHVKFLGVFIDNKLNWKKHISQVSNKLARNIGVILSCPSISTMTSHLCP